MIKGKVTGLAEIRRKIRRLREVTMPAASGAAAYGGMLGIMRIAKPLSPDQTKTLERSGYTTMPVSSPGVETVEGGFGGAADGYVVDVHEDTAIPHTTGESKFLESAANSKRASLPRTMGAKFRSALRNEKGARKAADMATDPWAGGS